MPVQLACCLCRVLKVLYLRGQVLFGRIVGLLMPWQLGLGGRDIRQACSCPVCDHAVICPQQVGLRLLLGLVPLMGPLDPAFPQSTHQLDNPAGIACWINTCLIVIIEMHASQG